MNLFEKYKKEISRIVSGTPDSVFLYWKGRVALYTILKSIGIKPGDEVILPGFTCVVVPNAIIYAGAKPVYVDISPDNYNMDIGKLEQAVTSRTRVIICQNTFGLSSNLESIIEIAKRHNLYTIEDCTHGFGGFYNGRPNGTFCDAAFYSTQWNKPFSTGIGGILVVRNPEIKDEIIKLESLKIKPSIIDQMVLKLLIVFRRYFVNNFTQNKMVSIFRFLSRHNLIIGSNQGYELSDVKMPENYFKDISRVQVKNGLKQLKELTGINKLRKNNAQIYTRFLKENKKIYVNEKYFVNHLFLKYPLLVKDRAYFSEQAIKSGVTLGDWFISPLHPVEKDLQLWEFEEGKFPVAVHIAKHILNLPTDIEENKKVIKFLKENLNEIM